MKDKSPLGKTSHSKGEIKRATRRLFIRIFKLRTQKAMCDTLSGLVNCNCPLSRDYMSFLMISEARLCL